MKRLLLLLIWSPLIWPPGIGAWQLNASPALHSLSADWVVENGGLSDLNGIYDAVVSVVYRKKHSGTATKQSGFFFAQDLVMTAADPRGDEIVCNSDWDVRITSGSFYLKGELPEPTFRCVEVAFQAPEWGVLVLRVVPIKSSKVRSVIPLIEPDFIVTGPHEYFISTLGYSAENRLFYSERCLIQRLDVQAQLLPLPTVRAVPAFAFSEVDCLYRLGMEGGPVFIRRGGKPVALGLILPLSKGPGLKTPPGQLPVLLTGALLFPKLWILQREYAKFPGGQK